MPDFSCYITIVNNLDVALTRVGIHNGYGSWATSPAESIASEGSTTFQLKDNAGEYLKLLASHLRSSLADIVNGYLL